MPPPTGERPNRSEHRTPAYCVYSQCQPVESPPGWGSVRRRGCGMRPLIQPSTALYRRAPPPATVHPPRPGDRKLVVRAPLGRQIDERAQGSDVPGAGGANAIGMPCGMLCGCEGLPVNALCPSSAVRPTTDYTSHRAMATFRPGDWSCSMCDNHNFGCVAIVAVPRASGAPTALSALSVFSPRAVSTPVREAAHASTRLRAHLLTRRTHLF